MSMHATETTTEVHKAAVRRLYEEVINARHLERAGQVVNEDYEGPAGERGAAGFQGTVRDLLQGFPDIVFTLEDLVAEGDRVAVRWRWEATHAGRFRTFDATHKRVTNSGIAIYQLRDGKVLRSWLETDRLGALQQIGAV